MNVESLQLTAEELAIVRDILHIFIPESNVCAFGSRVTGRTKKFSDLDLVILGEDPVRLGVMGDLSDAFTESDLPFKVDLVEWATITPAFRSIIAAAMAPVQQPQNSPSLDL